MSKEPGIIRAVKRAGSQSALARMIGVDRAAVQRWCACGYVPTVSPIGRDRAQMIADLTGVGYSSLLRKEPRKPGTGMWPRKRGAAPSDQSGPPAH